MCVPVANGVYVSAVAHVELAPEPVRVHVPVKFPVALVVKVTDPVGVVGAPEVSVTITLQLVGLFTITDDRLQVTVVLVEAPVDTVASSFVVRNVPSAPPRTYILLLKLDVAAESSLRGVGNDCTLVYHVSVRGSYEYTVP